MNLLKLLLTLGGLVGVLTITAPSGDGVSTTPDPGTKEKVKVEVQKVAPATPRDSHNACPPECPPFC